MLNWISILPIPIYTRITNFNVTYMYLFVAFKRFTAGSAVARCFYNMLRTGLKAMETNVGRQGHGDLSCILFVAVKDIFKS